MRLSYRQENGGNSKLQSADDVPQRRFWRPAGLAGLRFHDLRHTAATKLLEQDTLRYCGPDSLVCEHAVRIARRYGHIRPEV